MNFRTLDLNLLRVFDVVMAEGSITRAAQRLSMTQPAVSNALKRLRDSLGEDLLTRAPRGVQPTAFGEALWPQVRSSLGQLREALEPGEFDPTVDTRVFRLTMADAAAGLMLPALMARFEALGAHSHVEVRPLLDRDPRPLLGQGDIDFAIGHFPEAVAALVAQGRAVPLRHRRLAEGRYVCAMRRDHPLASEPLTLDAFCAASHVLVSFSGRPHGFVDHALASLKRTRHIALTVNQFFTAAHVVAACNHLTVLPARFLPLTGLQDRLVERELPVAPGTVYLDALWHVRHDRSAAHQWLLARFDEIAQAAAPA
ncbi:MAG TPA: LysR family transcriptional regulator [Piscinibacter sp.]|nr:LysR family transcriptional regulator [Piscinibacter sp.]MBK7533500.1 LysR family transcriptional regulator [Piscinibacter sp.]MBL0093444.1 LysR family transcriptional regulator [Piscinibacter sp.]MBP6541699.1 LysR family transcriptional regulator [Piscinibacter sp.]HNW65196.1 LysR family transcriptional regulator [Piscinibacter sp.]HOY35419.1 LysR family transcriptional regulator [Piscinibacter sp.]